MISDTKENKIFTLIIILFPILGVYSSGISSLTVSDIMLIAYIIYLCIFKGGGKIVVNLFVLVYFLICICQIIVQYISGIDYTFERFMKAVRFLLYIYTVMAISPSHFDSEYGRKMIVRVGLIVAAIAVIQFICSIIFHIYISGVIPILLDGEKTIYTNGITHVSGIVRISSVFVEPAHLASYLIPPTIVILFDDKYNSRIRLVLVILGLIVSISSTAYIMTAVLLILKCVIKNKNNENNKTTTNDLIINIFMLAMIVVFFIFFSNLGGFDLFIDRTFVGGAASEGRLNSYGTNILDNQIMHRIFGRGFEDSMEYMPSYPMILYRFGILGIINLAIMCIGLYFTNNDIVQRIVLIAFLILGIGTKCLISNMILFYISLVVCCVPNQ